MNQTKRKIRTPRCQKHDEPMTWFVYENKSQRGPSEGWMCHSCYTERRYQEFKVRCELAAESDARRGRDRDASPKSDTSAVIRHLTIEDKLLRVCARCRLNVDEAGNPDPEWYSLAWIAKFNEIPIGLRCTHTRKPIL